MHSLNPHPTQRNRCRRIGHYERSRRRSRPDSDVGNFLARHSVTTAALRPVAIYTITYRPSPPCHAKLSINKCYGEIGSHVDTTIDYPLKNEQYSGCPWFFLTPILFWRKHSLGLVLASNLQISSGRPSPRAAHNYAQSRTIPSQKRQITKGSQLFGGIAIRATNSPAKIANHQNGFESPF
jgi:hypothetical protein